MKPILFSTSMVQAILAGRKSQTRRIVKTPKDIMLYGIKTKEKDGCWFYSREGVDVSFFVKMPYEKGTILWVRETMYFDDVDQSYYYKADYTDRDIKELFEDLQLKATPSIFMKKQYARIFLKVTNVRAERLQDISEEDAKAEGAVKVHFVVHPIDGNVVYLDGIYGTYKEGFEMLWDSINQKRGYGWQTNPFVFVYELERVEVENG